MHTVCVDHSPANSSVAVLPLGRGESQLHLLLFALQLLTRLLKSNHPEDLQAANRLIKNLVKEVSIFAVGSVEDWADGSCL